MTEVERTMTAEKSDLRQGGWLERQARNLVLRMFGRIRVGRVILEEDGKQLAFGDPNAPPDLRTTIAVKDPRAYRSILARGTIGAGEAFMQGAWTPDDLSRTIRVFIGNPELYDAMDGAWTWITKPLLDAAHALRRNTRRGSKENIAAHYDLGNELFSLILDETMAYSSGIFEREDATLREASEAKFDRICRKLRLTPADHVIEIGTGWGGFCLHAARHYGCQVTTTTISREQFRYARERAAAAGLANRIHVLDQDYRDLSGSFDKLVSIEMIEAVGHRFLDRFLACCGRLLKPDGLMALQAITVRDDLYARHRGTATFINTHIFPGSFLPSTAAICRGIARGTQLRLVHLEDITPHYVRTLREWRARLLANMNKVQALGIGEELVRMLEFYFCYCEAAFMERQNAVSQMLFAMPENRQQPFSG
jgi:cyclopropane-fatty-acyl-phospholipid synthase